MPLTQFRRKESMRAAALEQQGALNSLAKSQRRFVQGRVEGAADEQKDGKVRGLLKIQSVWLIDTFGHLSRS